MKKTLYHGSNEKFNYFDFEKLNNKGGCALFLTENFEDAQAYGCYVYTVQVEYTGKLQTKRFRNGDGNYEVKHYISDAVARANKYARQIIQFNNFDDFIIKKYTGKKENQTHYVISSDLANPARVTIMCCENVD